MLKRINLVNCAKTSRTSGIEDTGVDKTRARTSMHGMTKCRRPRNCFRYFVLFSLFCTVLTLKRQISENS